MRSARLPATQQLASRCALRSSARPPRPRAARSGCDTGWPLRRPHPTLGEAPQHLAPTADSNCMTSESTSSPDARRGIRVGRALAALPIAGSVGASLYLLFSKVDDWWSGGPAGDEHFFLSLLPASSLLILPSVVDFWRLRFCEKVWQNVNGRLVSAISHGGGMDLPTTYRYMYLGT